MNHLELQVVGIIGIPRHEQRRLTPTRRPQRDTRGIELENARLEAEPGAIEMVLDSLAGPRQRPLALLRTTLLVSAERQVEMVAATRRQEDDGLTVTSQSEGRPERPQDPIETTPSLPLLPGIAGAVDIGGQ